MVIGFSVFLKHLLKPIADMVCYHIKVPFRSIPVRLVRLCHLELIEDRMLSHIITGSLKFPLPYKGLGGYFNISGSEI